MTAKMHYSGAICYDTARSTVHILGGYAVCCSGERTRKLKRDGQTTADRKKVTCKLCKAILAKRVHCKVHPKACCG